MTAWGYVEPEAKMKNEGLMYSKIRSFKYGEGVLARSANNGLSIPSSQLMSACATMKILFLQSR
jgi:hypothetical protein